jgi:hypothetical protein
VKSLAQQFIPSSTRSPETSTHLSHHSTKSWNLLLSAAITVTFHIQILHCPKNIRHHGVLAVDQTGENHVLWHLDCRTGDQELPVWVAKLAPELERGYDARPLLNILGRLHKLPKWPPKYTVQCGIHSTTRLLKMEKQCIPWKFRRDAHNLDSWWNGFHIFSQRIPSVLYTRQYKKSGIMIK